MNFNKLLRGMALGALLLLPLSSAQAALSTEQRLADFNQLVNIIQRNYGPLRWKQTTIGLDFPKVVGEYQQRAAAATSDAEFHRVLAQFISELKDAHVSPMVPSNHRANLGFVADFVEGKVLIESIDTLRLPEVLFPFKKGDQVLALGGVPVKQLMAELAKVGHTGHDASNDRITAARLTSRRQASGLAVPKGVITVTVLPKGAAAPKTVTATWAVFGSPLVDMDDLAGLMESSVPNAIPTAADGESFLADLKKLSLFNSILPTARLDEFKATGLSDIGNPRPMFKLPEGARELPGHTSTTAAIYEAGGKRIGLLRIPSYTDDNLVNELARAVKVMEEQTDVLVIDQTNNPGGSVAMVSDIVGLFAKESYKDMNFEIRPSLGWLTTFQAVNQEIADMLKANPADMAANALKARFDYMEAEIRDSIVNKQFLSNPVSLNLNGTFGMIQPIQAVNYSKPILLLINEFDFSGGDAFPALMKDNGRVTIFGAQTSGAGGNVSEYGPLSNSYFKLHLTESLMVRPNGEYMENRGVKPDIAYTVTEDDFMNGYRNYVQAFTAEALKLVAGQ